MKNKWTIPYQRMNKFRLFRISRVIVNDLLKSICEIACITKVYGEIFGPRRLDKLVYRRKWYFLNIVKSVFPEAYEITELVEAMEKGRAVIQLVKHLFHKGWWVW